MENDKNQEFSLYKTEKSKLDAVKNDPESIKYIKSPS